MSYLIKKAAVIGAGTMGAAIAAHLANAGVLVTLLDIVPRELDEKEKAKGLTLEDKVVRNRIVNWGFQSAVKSRPASFFAKDIANNITLGNLEDDFDLLADVDWIIEVIVENLKIKQGLMEKIEAVCKKDAIVSTNTSGIPVSAISEGRTDNFKAHFLGTHFFNPPRYLKLLEVIPTDKTSKEVIDYIKYFGEYRLGKGVVVCKDSPNFIANRLGSVSGAFSLDYIVENGYTIPEVDSITGPLMGRPKTATFRLLDLIGIDVSNHVRDNLADLIPNDALALKVLKAEKGKNVTDVMVEKGWLGNKTKQGFYKQTKVDGKKQFWPLNFETMEHEPAGDKPRFDSVGKARDIEDKGERLKVLMAGDDKASELAKAFTYFGLSYAALCIPEIADLPDAIDNAMKWGFVHDAGPFEIWDALGVADAAEKMKAEGYEVAAWVEEMLASGKETFYKYEGKIQTAIYDPIKKEYHPLPVSPVRINLQSLKDADKEVARNEGASLIDLGDGVACVEFHTKMNVFDTDIGAMLMEGMDIVEKDFDAMVVGNQGPHFSAGANLFLIVMHAQQEQWDELDAIVKGLQDLNMRMRYFPKPIVAAPFGYTLGGGAELMMHCNRVVASAETYTGLVEMGMGLLPAGGGSKEMLRRILNPAMRVENTEALSFLEKVFLQIGMAKVATSAEEARDFALLLPSDRVVMNQDHLLAEAKREARHMADTGYRPPTQEKIYAVGRDGLAAIKIAAWMFGQGGFISEHDALVADRVANVLSGGSLSKAQWVDEQYILDLEREYFLSLCGEKKTQERIWHFLQTGKPLRN